MAAVAMAAHSWKPASPVALYEDDLQLARSRKNPLASGAAAADGGLALTVTAAPAQPLVAVGVDYGDVPRVIRTFAA